MVGENTGSCCLPCGPVGDLGQAGVGSRAGHCLLRAKCCGPEMVGFDSTGDGLLHAICFGPEMVAFDSISGGPVLIAGNGPVMYCFLCL